MKKSLLVVLGALVSVCGVFAAGTADTNEGGAMTQTGEVTFPLEEPVRLHFMLQTQLHDDLNDLEIFQRMQEETNVYIDWEIVQSGWDEKRSLMFASNDLPDAFFGARALNTVHILDNVSFFSPLEEYVAAYAPNVQRMFAEDPSMEGYVTAPDGHIYSLPQRQPLRPTTRFISYINNEWLDAVGMAVPTNTEEFHEVLLAFKNEDPNGNGVADEIPLIFNQLNNNSGVNNLFAAFGLTDNTNGDWINLDDGELSYVLADDRLVEAVTYLHGLYEDGLFSSENFTRTWGQMVALNRNPDVAIVGVGFHWTIGAAMNSAERSAEYVALPPLRGPNGDQLWRRASILTVNPVAFSMPRSNAHPEITMAYVDQFYNPEVGIELYYGPVGRSLDLSADGTYTVLSSPDPDLTQDAWLWSNGMNDLSPVYFSRTFERRIQLGYPDEKAELEAVFAPYAADAEEFPPFLQYTPDEIEELAVIEAEIEDYAEQQVAQWIMNGNIGAEWDRYQSQLAAMGLPRMMEIYAAAYARYLGQ